MRLFVALTFEEEVRGQIAAVEERLQGVLAGGKPVPAENLHLTLAFLGDIDEDDVASVEDVLDDVASDPVFDLRFEHLGSFGGRRSRRGRDVGRTIWLGCEESKRLSHLQAEISDKLRRLGVELEDRPFTPHVTLARHAKLADGAGERPAGLDALVGEPIIAHISSYSLMESQRRDGGVAYERLCTWE